MEPKKEKKPNADNSTQDKDEKVNSKKRKSDQIENKGLKPPNHGDFYAMFNDWLTFKRIIESIEKYVPDIDLEISQFGMGIRSLDSSHTFFFSISMERQKCFKKFDFNDEKSYLRIGVKVEELLNILKLGDNKDDLHIFTNPKGTVSKPGKAGLNCLFYSTGIIIEFLK